MPNSGPASAVEVDERTAVWVAVLNRLAIGYPSGRFSQMGAAEITQSARVWAEDLGDVPAAAVEGLYRRRMQDWTGAWPPAVGDFRSTWLTWDYWAELNANPEAKAPVLAALPEAPPDNTAPGAAGYMLQLSRMQASGSFVCCECHNDLGNAPTAVLSRDKLQWVCAEGQCQFSWPVADTNGAPCRARVVVPKSAVRSDDPFRHESAEIREMAQACEVDWAAMTPPQRSLFRQTVMAATSCELKLEAMSVEQRADFMAWAAWYRGRYEAGMTYQVMELTWPIWASETGG